MRLKVTVSYDGAHYHGWQKQSNAHSIQSEIEGMLKKLHKHPVEIVASGRTDAQVHALGQVFHFDSEKNIDAMHWKHAMNSMLPKDIRIQCVEQVADDFHARFSAISKCYEYRISYDIDNPFLQQYAGLEKKHLDITYMQECATIFLGTHDFTSFTSAKIDSRKSRIKTITRLDVVEDKDMVRLLFEGTGFLRYMVRMLTQTLLEAGKHKLTKEEVQMMLDGKDKHLCRYKAEPQGLYLVHVTYGGNGNENKLSYTHNKVSSCSWGR